MQHMKKAKKIAKKNSSLKGKPKAQPSLSATSSLDKKLLGLAPHLKINLKAIEEKLNLKKAGKNVFDLKVLAFSVLEKAKGISQILQKKDEVVVKPSRLKKVKGSRHVKVQVKGRA